MHITSIEKEFVRDLARRYLDGIEIAERARRIENWRAINSLRPAPPPVYIRAFAWREHNDSKCVCENPLARDLENVFRNRLVRASFNDDTVDEPWFQTGCHYKSTGWGMNAKRTYPDEAEGLTAYKQDNPIHDYAVDLPKLLAPRLEIDTEKTDEREAEINDLIGDLMPVEMYRGTWARGWQGDIAMWLGNLRGMENLMLDVYERPDELKRLAAW